MSANETNLLGRLQRGDPSAFDEVYERYHVRLYGFLLRLAGRREIADDLFQETWEKLATNAARLRDDSDLAAWIFTVARNAYKNHRRWSLLDLGRLVVTDDALASVEVAAPSPEVHAQDRERLAGLDRALASLSVVSREALLLVGVEGLDQETAAVVVGTTHAAFRQRLSRARAELSALVDQRKGDPG